MDPIKSEYGDICQGCLSQDRKISPLGEYIDIFNAIIKQDSMFCVYSIKMCFECRAILKRIRQFQEQVVSARNTLMNIYFDDTTTDTQTLSKLKISSPIQIDQQYNYIPIPIEDIKEEPNSQKTESLINKLEKLSDLNIKRHSSQNVKECSSALTPNDDHHSDGEDVSLSTVTKETTDKKNKKSQNFEAYSQVVVTKTNIDMDSFEKYFTKQVLEEHEIQALYDNNQMCTRISLKKHNCNDCSAKFATKEELTRHVTLNHIKTEGVFKCLVCSKELPNYEDLKSHVLTVHSIYYRCDLCNTYFNYYNPRKSHLKTYHTKQYVCKECGMQLLSIKDYYKHRLNVHRRFMCDYCNKKVTSKKLIAEHIKRNHSLIECKMCNVVFKRYQHYRNHMRAQHKPIEEKEKELAFCVECNRQFSSIIKFRNHLSYAVKHKPKAPESFPCPECDKTYVKRTYMLNHYRQTHNRENSKYYCQICDKYYINGYSLRKHNKYVHLKLPKEKNHFCDLCEKAFSNKSLLENHRRTHTGERPFKCEFCSAAFVQRTAMISHQKRHAKNDKPK